MSSGMALYGIESELAQAGEEVRACLETGEEPGEGLLMRLAELAAMERTKADALAGFLVSLKADAEACADLARRQGERADRLLRARKRLDGYVLQVLAAAGKDKVRGVHHTLRVANSPVRLEVEEEERVPARFLVIQPPTLDRKAIKAALERGEEVPGTRLARSQHLRVET